MSYLSLGQGCTTIDIRATLDPPLGFVRQASVLLHPIKFGNALIIFNATRTAQKTMCLTCVFVAAGTCSANIGR
jgi:hypothetical protein